MSTQPECRCGRILRLCSSSCAYGAGLRSGGAWVVKGERRRRTWSPVRRCALHRPLAELLTSGYVPRTLPKGPTSPRRRLAWLLHAVVTTGDGGRTAAAAAGWRVRGTKQAENMHQGRQVDVLVHARERWRPPLLRTAAVDGGLQQVEVGAKASNFNHC